MDLIIQALEFATAVVCLIAAIVKLVPRAPGTRRNTRKDRRR